ncbi:hypothetical protein TNCV_3945981 [Trichonephila clavipes]|nr:hypothetical protein TNCV_3945981 [Trichonephila clavipes]
MIWTGNQVMRTLWRSALRMKGKVKVNRRWWNSFQLKKLAEQISGVQPGRRRKRITPVLVDAGKTAVDAQTQTSEFEGSSARAVSRQTGYSYCTVGKPPRSPDLTPRDLCLLGFLKCLVYFGGIATLNDFKNSKTLLVRSFTTDQLRSVVEHTVHHLDVLQVDERSHFKNLLLHRPGHD